MNYYRQCVLEKRRSSNVGVTAQVAWIPEHLAMVGRYVRIGVDNGWLVREAGSRQTGQYLQAHERDYMGHRSRTDV
jgi:hypothetical protein